jgi:hypothetical protein
MLELRHNSDQNPLSKVEQRAKQYFEDLSRDFSIMLSSERPERVVTVEAIEITLIIRTNIRRRTERDASHPPPMMEMRLCVRQSKGSLAILQFVLAVGYDDRIWRQFSRLGHGRVTRRASAR